METIAKVRRDHFVNGKGIRAIARDRGLSRNTVRKVIREGETAFKYVRQLQPRPQLDPFLGELSELLAGNIDKPRQVAWHSGHPRPYQRDAIIVRKPSG